MHVTKTSVVIPVIPVTEFLTVLFRNSGSEKLKLPIKSISLLSSEIFSDFVFAFFEIIKILYFSIL